ncbi:MAG: DUF2970 domain-containing protein [Acidiferrobacterales bacterium]|nr:DUF2970 domain-containing protein [Acidiferrobacterales bacterium]
MDQNSTSTKQAAQRDSEEVGALDIIKSVFAAFFGVQSDRNRERDFASGKFWHFFVAGVIFVLLFMAAVYGVVQYLLATTPTGGV